MLARLSALILSLTLLLLSCAACGVSASQGAGSLAEGDYETSGFPGSAEGPLSEEAPAHGPADPAQAIALCTSPTEQDAGVQTS